MGARPGWAKPASQQAEPELEPVPARLWVVAPSAQGQWLVRIDNEGDEPLRIAADVRLLRFEVWPQAKGKWARRAEVCDGPKAFGLSSSFPAGRELLLKPGESWVESFDPRLICFGKQAKLLEGGALVRAHFGWPPLPRWRKDKPRELVAADATQVPRRYEARRELVAPTMLLSHLPPEPWARTIDQSPIPPPKDKHHKRRGRGAGGDQPDRGRDGGREGPAQPAQPAEPGAAAESSSGASGPSEEGSGASGDGGGGPTEPEKHGAQGPPPSKGPKDELGSRLALTADRFADALYPRDAVVGVQVYNAGERDGRVALRSRQLSFRVQGPDGVVECPRRTLTHVVPPDLFGRLQEGKHVTIDVLLAELCPPNSFKRPGLYVAMPTIHATDVDREKRVSAITGEVSTLDPGPSDSEELAKRDATLVRIRRGIESLYPERPLTVPTTPLHGQPPGQVAQTVRDAADARRARDAEARDRAKGRPQRGKGGKGAEGKGDTGSGEATGAPRSGAGSEARDSGGEVSAAGAE